MLKILFKIFVFLTINFFVVKGLYLDNLIKTANANILIKPVYTHENYKYWSKEDGTKYCKNLNAEELHNTYIDLNKYIGKKTNVILFENVDILDCKDFVQTIAVEFHKRNLEIAFILEKNFELDKVFPEKFTKFTPQYYSEKFNNAGSTKDWVDYIIFDHASNYLTYVERRDVQTELRKIFTKQSIGFRFPDLSSIGPAKNHELRSDKIYDEFLPKDDDGDFIITHNNIEKFRRTFVIVDNEELSRIGIDGEFIH